MQRVGWLTLTFIVRRGGTAVTARGRRFSEADAEAEAEGGTETKCRAMLTGELLHEPRDHVRGRIVHSPRRRSACNRSLLPDGKGTQTCRTIARPLRRTRI